MTEPTIVVVVFWPPGVGGTKKVKGQRCSLPLGLLGYADVVPLLLAVQQEERGLGYRVLKKKV